MPMFTSLSREASRLSAGLQGQVILPGQPRFDEARRAFHLAAGQGQQIAARAGDEQREARGDEGRL